MDFHEMVGWIQCLSLLMRLRGEERESQRAHESQSLDHMTDVAGDGQEHPHQTTILFRC
jgi:hypothetical protein